MTMDNESELLPDLNSFTEILENNPGADSVRSVCIATQTPYKMWEIKNGYLIPLIKNKSELHSLPRQSLPEIYFQNAHIDIIKYETIIKKKSMSGEKIIPYIMDEKYIWDIDKPIDIDIIGMIMRKNHE